MRAAQDVYFAATYMAPAQASADALCVRSNLGKSMLYDLAIQSGPARLKTLAPKAMKAPSNAKDAACRPCNPDGPSEADFLDASNDERRSYVESLGGDAAKSVYREDFFADMLDAGNADLGQVFVIKGLPVKGLPTPVPPLR